MRAKLSTALKEAMKAKDEIRLGTVRLILAALKDRDIAARGKGQPAGVPEDEILAMLSGMIKQRRDSIALYEQGGRSDLAARERAEIAVIEGFLPVQLDEAGIRAAVQEGVKATGATGVKDLGALMAWLKGHYAGQMDFARAATLARQSLAG